MEENVSVDFAELAPRVGLLLMEKWILEIRLARLLEAQRPPEGNGLWDGVIKRNEAADGATTEIPAGTP